MADGEDVAPPAEVGPTRPSASRRRKRTGMTLGRFRKLEAALRAEGYGETIEWSQTIQPPRDARAFAREVIYVICNSGMRVTTANRIYWRCRRALNRRQSAATVFGHRGKAAAIDHVWQHRRILWAAYQTAENKLAYCETLPFIGPVTKHHLAKNLGVNTVKPDVHLARLAKAERVTLWELCHRLAKQTGYREATIDTILWRACADGVLDSWTYLSEGWAAAFHPGPIEALAFADADTPGSGELAKGKVTEVRPSTSARSRILPLMLIPDPLPKFFDD